MDALHYFHYGQLVHHGEAKGDVRLLAKSSGISDEFIKLVLETAKVPALENAVGASWGLLRTKRGQPLTVARAEKSESGAICYQFIQMPADAVRGLAGNLNALKQYLLEPLPEYAMLGDELSPIQLDNVTLTTEQQVDNLLDLMSYTRNNTRNIQPLIAAIVSGTSLIIINAPQDGETRMGFIQGLLTLLPSSTRPGVTFLTHAIPGEDVTAQLMFMEATPDNENQVVYDWASGKVSGKEVKNDYSRFVTGQMRLDPEQVIRETEKLTMTAGWRFNSGDNLAKALDYASHRAKVDQSLDNNMPVELASVAKILLEDPTLSDKQRLMYSRHLINFSLAMDDLQYVDAITATMNQHKDIENEVYKYMSKALNDGQGAIIFETLVRWQENPFSPTGQKWQQMLAKAALSELDELIEAQDAEMISDYLEDIQHLGRQATPIIGRVIDRVLPMASRDPDIPTKILLLAIQNLDDTKLQSLMSTSRFVQPLPTDVKRLLALFSQRERKAPPGTLIRAVQSVPEAQRTSALIAFIKLSYSNKRIDLLDERVLNELVKALNINPTLIDGHLLTGIAESVQTNTLKTMKRPAPRLVLQLLLQSQNYVALDTLMIAQSRDIYGAEGQRDYIQSIQETFAKTSLTASDALTALRTFEKMELNPVPRAAALLGALEGTGWNADLKSQADTVMKDVADSQGLLEALPAQSIYSLLKYMARQGDIKRLRIATRIMGSCAAHEDSRTGLSATNIAYKLLDSSGKTRPFAIEVVRQYIREAQEKPARHMIKFYGDRLGADVSRKLQLSYEFSNLMARMDWITYASSLKYTVKLLQSVVNAYEHPASRPNLGDARLLVEQFRREFSLGQQRELSSELKRITHAIVVLSQRHDRRSSKGEKHKVAIAEGKNDPRSVLDVYRASGAYLLGKTAYPFRTKEGKSYAPLGDGTPEDLLINITIASSILHEATGIRPGNREMWTASALFEEIESQTATLFGDTGSQKQQMGRNWQRLADLIIHIAKQGDPKIIEANNSKGRKLEKLQTAPENTLELFRFIYGYFAG